MTRLQSIAAAIARSTSLRASAGRVARGLQGVIPVGDDSNNTIAFQFEKLARQQPAHPFLLYGNHDSRTPRPTSSRIATQRPTRPRAFASETWWPW